MEGLRISIVLVVSFVAGMCAWGLIGPGVGLSPTEHLVAGTTCEACTASCTPFLSSR